MINLLQNEFSQKDFVEYVNSYLPDFRPTDSRVEKRRGFLAIKQIGESPSLDLVVFATTPESSIHARMEISKQSYALLKNHPRAHALIAYHSDETEEWRLSLITTQVTRNKKGIKETVSNPRRFSYVLGPKAKVNTPTKYLITSGKIIDLDDLKARFSLEVVNKDFYREISSLFIKLTGGTFTSGKNKSEYKPLLQLPSVQEKDQKNLEFAVRLIGRVIFCWFLREKKSVAGASLMPKELLSLEAINQHADYYHSILEPIFFEILNKQIKSRKDRFATESFSSIPYLNGGLFSPDYDDYFSYNEDKQAIFHNTVIVPDDWLKEFFTFLETYNFTIDENVSFDEELSIDPEMLGRIFENLLAEINPETGESERKSTGSYYTPRSIVDYMVDESLLAYLKEKTSINEPKLRALISYNLEDNLAYPLTVEEFGKVIDSLSTVKILDPACGSGAFPIGALQKIVFILQQVDPDGRRWFEKQIVNTAPEIKRVIEREFANKNFNYIRKLGVIRENIFGVDIQPIATEISRLRCFLTLVVDESIHDELENRGIEPLPNLDFKFVTANTLIQLPGGNEQSLFKDMERINQLSDLRNQFFSSTNSERQRLQLEFKELQNQMLDRMIETRGGDEITRTLSTWNPFSHKVTSWFDPKWMFGVEEKFDIVIGNPPYFVYQGHSKGEIEALREIPIYDIASGGKLNAFKLFLACGKELLRTNGTLTFIFQNSFLADNSAKKLRQFFLSEQKIISIDSFPERDNVKKRVFESVKMSVCILVSINQKVKEYTFPLKVWEDKTRTIGWQTIFSNVELTNYDPIATPIPYLKESEKEIFKKCFSTKNQDKIRCYEGELNMTFHKHLFVDDSSQPKIIKGAQVLRYLLTDDMSQGKVDFVDQKRYLEQNKGEKSSHHELKRIALQGITGVNDNRRIIATLIPERVYCANSCNYIVTTPKGYSLESLLGVLNSTLLNWIFKKTSTNSNVNTYEIANLPLPTITPERIPILRNIEVAVSEIIEKKRAGKAKQNDDITIDQQVYKLYNLTAEEIDIIEEKAS